MVDFDYPRDMTVGRVGLEMSLKPFKRLDDAYIEAVCEELFDQWRDLIRRATGVAVMLWTSDGSEILEYNGDLDSEFEWCKLIGIGNPKRELPAHDPEGKSLHSRPVLYMDDPHPMRYSDLKRIVSALKRVGKRMCGMDILVVETFDPGPEFAYSKFKYEWHPEVSLGDCLGAKMWMHCAARLHADDRQYAAYPNGIPEGLHLGRFLGEQFMALKRDVGFDTIWLSNGFGFALQPWGIKGELFDGERFDSAAVPDVSAAINEFWHEFTTVTGDMIVETRGSNLSAGMDISSHGTPVDEIYRYRMVAPPNSPWAALDFRFGLELVGYMSRIANLPENGYLFRYYTHDPWWQNSPWFDRYGRSPHDIYLPLAIARLDEKGVPTPPNGINFLSVDDSFGNMPRKCPIEVTPHVLEAFSHQPDAVGPLTWLYPFDEYVRIGLREGRPQHVFMGDWLVENALDEGLPLSCVVSDTNFRAAELENYRRSVLLAPVPEAGSLLEASILRALDAGLSILLYGGTARASDELRALLGVQKAPELAGDFRMETDLCRDQFRDAPVPRALSHEALLSEGGLGEVFAGGAEQLAAAVQGADVRAYASFNPRARAGRLAWLRGSFPHTFTKRLPALRDKNVHFPVGAMLRYLLERFDLRIRHTAEHVASHRPIILTARCDNALYITGFAKDTIGRTTLALPEGAPLMSGTECMVDENGAEYPLRRWWHEECRVFIRQKKRSLVTNAIVTAGDNIENDYRRKLTGLEEAEITFYAPKNVRRVTMVLNDNDFNTISDTNVEMTVSEDGLVYTARNLTGFLYIAWGVNN